jgi:DNA-binding SARP family transcriptional activator/Tfp pilus assembly protein PilF
MPDAGATSDRPRLRLFGPFRLLRPDGAAARIATPTGRALIAHLYLTAPKAARREDLAGLIWSGPEARAKAALNQCVQEVRQALAAARLDLILINRDRLGFRRDVADSDLEDLEAALGSADAERLMASLLAIGASRLLEDGPAGGAFGDWIDETRARLDERIAEAVRDALTRLEAEQDWDRVRRLADIYLQRDPLDETVVASAMRADAAAGRTSAAHRRYQVLQTALAKGFGAEPGSAAREAMAAIARRQSAEAPPASARRAAAPAEVPPLVVVAAFEAGDPADPDGRLAAVLREEVVSGLARFHDLRVVTDPEPLYEIGRKLADGAVTYVMGASLRKSGSGTRLTVQLADAGDRRVIWSDGFPLAESEAAATIDGIIAKVVGAVLPTIDADLTRQARLGTGARVYERYLLARDAAYVAETYDGARAAADELETLIKADPAFPLPYLPLARLYNTDFSYTRAGSSGPKERAEALRLSKHALTLDRGHVHGYTVTGWCYLRSRLWEPARAHFDQALSLNSFHAARTKEVGFGLIFLGDVDRARALLDRSLLLNPAPEDDFFMCLGLLELVRGDHDRAASYLELVAQPTMWSEVYGAMNAAMAGRPSEDRTAAARTRIAAIWPADSPWDPEAVVRWIGDHHPFRHKDAETRFLDGARLMLALT